MANAESRGNLLLQAEQSPYVAESRDSGDAQSQEVLFGRVGVLCCLRWVSVFRLFPACNIVFCRTLQHMSGATVVMGQRTPTGESSRNSVILIEV
jgi:hypothetical protein